MAKQKKAKKKTAEKKAKALGAPWAGLVRILRLARDAEIAVFKKAKIPASIKRSWIRNRKREYTKGLKVMTKLVARQRKKRRQKASGKK